MTRRALAAWVAVVLGAMGTAASAGPAGARVTEAKAAPSYAPGDCFADGDVTKDVIDLGSEVSCKKNHMVQVVSGTTLPASLAGAGYTNLLSPTSSVRSSFVAFADLACGVSNFVNAVYPKQAGELNQLLLRNDVTDVLPPVPGRRGWALPDQASFDAGVTDVLCAHNVDQEVFPTTAGDVRKVGTSATLPNFRACINFDASDQSKLVTCSKPHRDEDLIYLDLLVTGRPASVNSWADADWAPYDAMCNDFVQVLVGAQRKDLIPVAEVLDYNAEPVKGRRLFSCLVKPAGDDDLLPPGTVVGLGAKKLAVRKG